MAKDRAWCAPPTKEASGTYSVLCFYCSFVLFVVVLFELSESLYSKLILLLLFCWNDAFDTLAKFSLVGATVFLPAVVAVDVRGDMVICVAAVG